MMGFGTIPTPAKRLGLTHPRRHPTRQRPRRMGHPHHLDQQVLGLPRPESGRIHPRQPLPQPPHLDRRRHTSKYAEGV
jgi:hypothetical protein